MRLPWALPVVQAPVGGGATTELVAAVSAAGGLGCLAGSWAPPAVLRERVREIARATDRPFCINLVVVWDQRERLETVLDEGAPAVSFTWGVPADLIAATRARGALALVQVGSVAEAREAVAAGADGVIAQGVEAGGHVRGNVGLLALLREVRAAVDVPVIGAGGIADAAGAAAARVAGADAVALGTRFLLSSESGAHPAYVDALLAAGADDTVLLDDLFDVGWPRAQHRTLRNVTVRRWEEAGRPPSGQRPGEGETIARHDGRDIVRYGDDAPLVGTTGDVEALALYCGQGVGLIDSVEPAGAIVERIAAGFARP